MISDLDPETPRKMVINEFPPYLHEVKQALIDTLPNSTEQTMLGYIKGWNGGEISVDVPDTRYFYFKLYDGAEIGDTVTMPDATVLTIQFAMDNNVVYAVKRNGLSVELVSGGLPQTMSIGCSYRGLPFANQDYNFLSYQMIKTGTTSKVDFNNENMAPKPGGPCLLTFITSNAAMPYIDTFIASLADIRVSSEYDLDPRIIVKPAAGKPGCWEMFFDGSMFYITDYEELGHI